MLVLNILFQLGYRISVFIMFVLSNFEYVRITHSFLFFPFLFSFYFFIISFSFFFFFFIVLNFCSEFLSRFDQLMHILCKLFNSLLLMLQFLFFGDFYFLMQLFFDRQLFNSWKLLVHVLSEFIQLFLFVLEGLFQLLYF